MHDDLVRKVFTADAVNRLWLTDITEHPTGEGKLYLCAIKDVYSGRIVGYSINSRMKASLAVSALRNAVRLRDPAGTVVHSDRLNLSNFGLGNSYKRYTTTVWSAPWAAWAHAATTPRWSRSSPCCRRTSSTASGGAPANSYAWRS